MKQLLFCALTLFCFSLKAKCQAATAADQAIHFIGKIKIIGGYGYYKETKMLGKDSLVSYLYLSGASHQQADFVIIQKQKFSPEAAATIGLPVKKRDLSQIHEHQTFEIGAEGKIFMFGKLPAIAINAGELLHFQMVD